LSAAIAVMIQSHKQVPETPKNKVSGGEVNHLN